MLSDLRFLRSLPVPPRLRSQRGNSLIEMALGGTLLFLLIFGIMEFGRAIWVYNTIAHAAREGTRYAIVRGAESSQAATAADVDSYVQSRATGVSGLTVTTTWVPDNQFGSVVQVRVESPFQPIVPLFPSLTLTSTSRLVIDF